METKFDFIVIPHVYLYLISLRLVQRKILLIPQSSIKTFSFPDSVKSRKNKPKVKKANTQRNHLLNIILIRGSAAICSR